jgi:hypothetical protein
MFPSIVLAAALAQPPAADIWTRPPVWKRVFIGVYVADLTAERPRPMQGYAVRINLRSRGVRFTATPGNGDREQETDGTLTSTFLAREKCQVAINAAPFAPIHTEEGLPQDVVGLHVSRGRLVSEAHEKWPALLIGPGNEARIAAPPFDLRGVHTAVGGFGIVLKDGKVSPGNADVHPRTAVGLRDEGRRMIWLVIDGRQPGYSAGATTADVGRWLAGLGCTDGINLDGGGTTALVFEGADGKPDVRNRPIHANKPGTERVAGSHLGLYARRPRD